MRCLKARVFTSRSSEQYLHSTAITEDDVRSSSFLIYQNIFDLLHSSIVFQLHIFNTSHFPDPLLQGSLELFPPTAGRVLFVHPPKTSWDGVGPLHPYLRSVLLIRNLRSVLFIRNLQSVLFISSNASSNTEVVTGSRLQNQPVHLLERQSSLQVPVLEVKQLFQTCLII